MSAQALNAVWALGVRLTAAERLVLVRMADRANAAGGDVYLAQTTIALECGLHRATVQAAIETLRKRRLIEIVEAPRQHLATTYRLPFVAPSSRETRPLGDQQQPPETAAEQPASSREGQHLNGQQPPETTAGRPSGAMQGPARGRLSRHDPRSGIRDPDLDPLPHQHQVASGAVDEDVDVEELLSGICRRFTSRAPQPDDAEQIATWLADGVTSEDVDAALASLAAWSEPPAQPWGALRSAIGVQLGRRAIEAAKPPEEPRTLTAAEVAEALADAAEERERAAREGATP